MESSSVYLFNRKVLNGNNNYPLDWCRNYSLALVNDKV